MRAYSRLSAKPRENFGETKTRQGGLRGRSLAGWQSVRRNPGNMNPGSDGKLEREAGPLHAFPATLQAVRGPLIEPRLPLAKLASQLALHNIERGEQISSAFRGVHGPSRHSQPDPRLKSRVRAAVSLAGQNDIRFDDRVVNRLQMPEFLHSEIAKWICQVQTTWDYVYVHGKFTTKHRICHQSPPLRKFPKASRLPLSMRQRRACRPWAKRTRTGETSSARCLLLPFSLSLEKLCRQMPGTVHPAGCLICKRSDRLH